jgi:transposase-like protein
MATERRHRRHPTELKVRLVESYLNGEGSLKSIAKAHDITHTLLMIWLDKYRRGELNEPPRIREVHMARRQTYGAPLIANAVAEPQPGKVCVAIQHDQVFLATLGLKHGA